MPAQGTNAPVRGDALRHAAEWQALRPHWPSWCASSLFHAAVLLLAYVTVGRSGVPLSVEPGRRVEITLAPPRAEAMTSPTPLGEVSPRAESAIQSLNEIIAEQAAALQPSDLLPPPRNAIGAGNTGGGATSASGMERGSGHVGMFGNDGARTEVFGITATGNRFAYVFDRSGSMGGPGGNLLQAAKAELLRSLDHLSDLQQFQIIFYNETPTVMNLAAQPGRLVLASDDNKALAREFLARVIAGGGTRHEEALAAALRMRPDVIFFLTDADEPTLTKDQLARIRRLNDERTQIHTIEFGHGPKIGGEANFIVQLAAQNRGEYRYLDVTRELAR